MLAPIRQGNDRGVRLCVECTLFVSNSAVLTVRHRILSQSLRHDGDTRHRSSDITQTLPCCSYEPAALHPASKRFVCLRRTRCRLLSPLSLTKLPENMADNSLNCDFQSRKTPGTTDWIHFRCHKRCPRPSQRRTAGVRNYTVTSRKVKGSIILARRLQLFPQSFSVHRI